ncbi:MAG: DUF2341 domain-containing protein [Candidatus Omnitrophica bacterium]|nr:DUF2341 domain-containing protein [Candidatus Omnitrophota bacterium]
MRKLTLIMILALVSLAMPAAQTDAATVTAKRAVFERPLSWRADGAGQYAFKGNVTLTKAAIATDGSVQSASGGTCELTMPYTAAGKISTISANWTFTGKVTLEVSATGNEKDYVAVTNGVPLAREAFAAGSGLKWRAALDAGSALTEVKIAYTDSSGVSGTFGNPDISGFAHRKKVYIENPSKTALYNFQMQLKIGESKKSANCAFYLDTAPLPDFTDIRFTQADGQTSLPYFIENVNGKKASRTAAVWLKIPEIPKEGLPIYIYYGNSKAADLSSAAAVFDFFDDFTANLNSAGWKVELESKDSLVSVSGSTLAIDAARVTTSAYKFYNGIIEYRAKMVANGGIECIIIAGASRDEDLSAYSSIMAASAHCIVKNGKVLANYPKQISLDTYYDFGISANGGDITFARYADGSFEAPQAEVKVSLSSAPSSASPIGFSAGKGGTGFVCDWIRTRRYAALPPQVDAAKTASSAEETTDLPRFDSLTLAPDGSVVPASGKTTGTYTSRLTTIPFDARILTAAWTEAAPDDNPIKVSVSTKEDASYVSGWSNGRAKYVSKKEFTKGNKLRYKVVITKASAAKAAPSLEKFTLGFEPGTIKVISPAGGEIIAPLSAYSIMWETTGYEDSYFMDISYSDDGGLSFRPIAPKVANTGSYEWKTPEIESAEVIMMVADSLDKSVCGVSEAPFSITTYIEEGKAVEGKKTTSESEAKASSETVKKEESKAAEEEKKPGAKKYDILLKLGDNVTSNADEDARASFKEGDIVMIKPAGYNWSDTERHSFLIVQAELTEAEAADLMRPEETVIGKDKTGKDIVKVTGARKYKIDLNKRGLAIQKDAAMKGMLKYAPVVSKAEIDDKGK